MLPASLRLVYAFDSATFQVSSLALLSIVNTRVSIPAEYLPAYGAISFLPYSLRPIFAWISSLLLKRCKTRANKNRHDTLLFPAFLLASLSFVGTIFIPSGGILLCFFWGFLRGIAGAWTDFLMGMAVIEFSKLQVSEKYEHSVSVHTAQSSTAKNVGSFVASITTFAYFQHHPTLEVAVANKLLLGTAAIYFLAALVSLRFQLSVGNLLANVQVEGYEIVEDADEEEQQADNDAGMHYSSSSFQHSSSVSDHSGSETFSDGLETISSPELKEANRRQMFEVSTLVAFQILLAFSALQKPIIAISNQTTWISLVVTIGGILISIISLGYKHERKSRIGPHSSRSCGSSPNFEDEEKEDSKQHRLPHNRLNLYFLLRYSLPIAGFLMYSYLYSVFEKEPSFLQLLSVLKTAIGSLSTFCYEKFLSPYCHSGWPLIGLIASLDIVMGFVALTDVWVIRAVKEKEVDGEYVVDTQLKYLVAAVGLAKYFFAELDYMPALVLSTTNVYSDDGEKANTNNDIGEPLVERTLLENASNSNFISPLSIDSIMEEDCDAAIPPTQNSVPVLSAGMQYASFLSCIDFGAQIGDWITIPIVASLGITRDNHWDNLDKLVIICSLFRMARVLFLWLIFPPADPKHKVTNTEYVNDSNE